MKNFTPNDLLALTTDQLIALMRELSAGLAAQIYGPADRDSALAILALIRAILAQRRQANRLPTPAP